MITPYKKSIPLKLIRNLEKLLILISNKWSKIKLNKNSQNLIKMIL